MANRKATIAIIDGAFCSLANVSTRPGRDQFNDVFDTLLTNHESETGHTWSTQTTPDPQAILIRDVRISNAAGLSNVWQRTAFDYVPRNNSYVVGACINIRNRDIQGLKVGVGCRTSGPNATAMGYYALLTQGGGLELIKIISGTITPIMSLTDQWDDEIRNWLELSVILTTIKVTLNGEVVIQKTDTSISEVGKPGIWWQWSPVLTRGAIKMPFFYVDDSFETTGILDDSPEIPDTITVIDSIVVDKVSTQENIQVGEVITVMDNVTVNKANVADLLETVTVIDGVSVDKGGDKNINITELVSVIDSAGLPTKEISLAEIINVLEVINSPGGDRSISMTETITVTDLPFLPVKQVWLNEVVTVSDLAGLVVPIQEIIAVNDTIDIQGLIEILETVKVKETLAISVLIALLEQVTVQDLIGRLLSIEDSVTVLELITKLVDKPLSLDLVKAKDSVIVSKRSTAAFSSPEETYFARPRSRFFTINSAKRIA